MLGMLKKGRIWEPCNDATTLLLADVGESLEGTHVTNIMAASRTVAPLPPEYEEIGEAIPQLVMLGPIGSDRLAKMPCPCILTPDWIDEELRGDPDVYSESLPPLVALLEKSGPILINQGFSEDDLTYGGNRQRPVRRRWQRDKGYSLPELRALFPKSSGYLIESADDFELPTSMPSTKRFYAVLTVNEPLLFRRKLAATAPKRKPRKKRPPALPVELTVDQVRSWVYAVRNKTSDCFLRHIDHWRNVRDLDNCWGTMVLLIATIERLYGKYAYRRLAEYREAYQKLMTPVMKNPTGCIRKMHHINAEFSYWLEQETLSKEAKQIQQGTFVVANKRHISKRPSTINNLPEDYRLERLPRCMRKPKPVPVPKGTTDESDETAQADREAETVSA